MAENFYDLLGVSEDASTAEIEDAYREAIKRVHPDVSDDVDAGERTKRLNKAKRVLTDDAERARYDRAGHDSYLSGGSTESASSTGTASTVQRAGGQRSYSGETTGGSYGRRQRGRASGTTAGRANRPGSGSSAASGSDGSWSGRRRGSTTGQGRSASSNGPTWQSGRTRRATASGAAGDGPSARRQAAAGRTDGPNADWSWNAWEQTRSWAVRQSQDGATGFDPNRFVPDQQSSLLLMSTFFLYPFFVGSALFPPFPFVARLLVGVCTLMMFGYLLSVPQVAVAVFGLWSVVTPIALVALPSFGLFTLVGIIALSATWVPFALSLLMLSVLETW